MSSVNSGSGMSYRSYKIYPEFIEDVRVYMRDKPAFNRLIEGNEHPDESIRLATQLFLASFNSAPPPLDTMYNLDNFPNPLLLIKAVVVELLKGAGILEARNAIDFQDAGLSFSTVNRHAIYDQIAQQLKNEVYQEIQDLRESLNASEGYSVALSPESWLSPFNWNS